MMQETAPNENRLADLLELLDSLHNAASEGELERQTGMTRRELVGLLQECIYTAGETIAELDRHAMKQGTRPVLRVLDKPA